MLEPGPPLTPDERGVREGSTSVNNDNQANNLEYCIGDFEYLDAAIVL